MTKNMTKSGKVVPIKRTDVPCLYLTEEEARGTPDPKWFVDVVRERVPRARSIVDLLCLMEGNELNDTTDPGTPEKALEAARDQLLAVEEALRRFDELVERQREVAHG
jgi:hypothetical protein